MAPTLVASRTALPPEGAGLAWGGPALAAVVPTLVASRTALPPEGAGLAWGSPALAAVAPTLVASAAPSGVPGGGLTQAAVTRTLITFSLRERVSGFTLIELLVALAAMALMAGLSWRGLDGMVRAQTQLQQRADAVLTLQAGLTQWGADLDGLIQLPQTSTLDWDGRALRVVRRNAVVPGGGLLVVAWTRRSIGGTGQWLRWQSPPVFTRSELQAAWVKAGQWAQNPGDDEKRFEVHMTALDEWQIFYFRGNAWTNPLSSDTTTPQQTTEKPVAADVTLPDGIRLVMTLPPGEAINGVLTRDWVRPVTGGNKS